MEWDIIEQSPFGRGKSLLLKENNQRIRYLTEDEIVRLLQECNSPKQRRLYRIVVCALNTGMRKGEILNLRWNQIRNGFIYLEKTKTKNRREIPVNGELAVLIKKIGKEEGLTSEYVFTYSGRAIDRVDRVF